MAIACMVVAVALSLTGLSAASTPRTVSYEVVAASSTAHLGYSGATSQVQRAVAGAADSSAHSLKPQRHRATQHVSLTSGGGRVIVRLATKRSERATLSQRSAPTQPYVEQTCRDSAKGTSSGGLLLTRLSGGRIQVRWAFPHAIALTCPGPSGVGKRLTSKMVRIYPASRFTAGRITLSLFGSARFRQGAYTGSYRWRASVTLSRT